MEDIPRLPDFFRKFQDSVPSIPCAFPANNEHTKKFLTKRKLPEARRIFRKFQDSRPPIPRRFPAKR